MSLYLEFVCSVLILILIIKSFARLLFEPCIVLLVVFSRFAQCYIDHTAVPECTVTATALGHSDVMCEVQCNNTASVTFSTSDVSLTRTDCQGSVGEDLTGGGEGTYVKHTEILCH